MQFKKLLIEMSMNAFPQYASPIKKEEIPYTFAYIKDLFKYLKVNKLILLGSAGKKDISGDIDIGIETNKSLKEVSDFLTKNDVRNKINKGLKQIYSLFPIHDKNGRTGKYCQVDFMFGKLKWLKFAYYSPGKDSKYKGVHRNLLLSAAIKYGFLLLTKQNKNYWSINWAKGLYYKQQKNKYKITDDPFIILKLLSKATHKKWYLSDLKTAEILWNKIQKTFPEAYLNKIKEYVISGLKNSKIKPDETLFNKE